MVTIGSGGLKGDNCRHWTGAVEEVDHKRLGMRLFIAILLLRIYSLFYVAQDRVRWNCAIK